MNESQAMKAVLAVLDVAASTLPHDSPLRSEYERSAARHRERLATMAPERSDRRGVGAGRLGAGALTVIPGGAS